MTYTAQVEQNAITQRFFLAIVDSSGAVHPEYGQVELRLSDIRDILKATTATPIDSGSPPGKISFKEVQFCQPDGTVIYGIVPVGGFYTKT